MKKNRVDCADCIQFIQIVFEEPNNLFSKIKTNAECKLGKRVMFRQPINQIDNEYGWFRYCDEFNDKINEK